MVYSLKPVLIFGAKGFLGQHLYRYFCSFSSSTLGTHHKPADELKLYDLANPKIDWNIEGYGYAFLTASIANPVDCEREQQISYSYNVENTYALGKQLIDRGVIPVFFSSDYVFDGTAQIYEKDADFSPLNTYGKQKAQLEQLAHQLPEMLIIRSSRVYGLTRWDHTLYDEMASKLVCGNKIKVASDQIFSPICIDDLVKGVAAAISEGKRGVLQAAGPEGASRYEMALYLSDLLGVSRELIEPIKLSEIHDGVRRPEKIIIKSDIPAMSWKEGCQKICRNWK